MDADRRDDEIPIGPDLTALENRLATWRPAAGPLDRDRMLYDAGRAAATAGGRPWRLASAALVLVSIGLGGALVHQRRALVSERSILAREISLRHHLETRLADRISGPGSALPLPKPPDAAPEPPAASSYTALTARLIAGLDQPRDPDEAGPLAPAGGLEPAPAPTSPLRPHDLDRVRDL